MAKLCLFTFFQYLNATPASRTVIEGEAILNANHVVACGIKGSSKNSIEIMGLVLQGSATTTGPPHEVLVEFGVDKDKNLNVIKSTCTCKAGLSSRCKHVSGILLQCTRQGIDEMEQFSGTDLKCWWNSKKKNILKQYAPKPIEEWQCIPKITLKRKMLSEDNKSEILNSLMGANPNSALTKHYCRRRKSENKDVSLVSSHSNKYFEDVNIILNNAKQNTFMCTIDPIKVEELIPCCGNIMAEFFKSDVHEAALATSNSGLWHQERKFRITGSRIYSIFTYSKDDWRKKCKDYFWPKLFTNKYIEHGRQFENAARELYKVSVNPHVIETGLIISQHHPWLGYTPDGIVFKNNIPVKLLEIKCPYKGKEVPSIAFINECTFLEITEEGVRLKRKHMYYAQVQLGMAILNLTECDFIVYSSGFNNFINIIVPFDEEFTKHMIEVVKEKYQYYMLHQICENLGNK